MSTFFTAGCIAPAGWIKAPKRMPRTTNHKYPEGLCGRSRDDATPTCTRQELSLHDRPVARSVNIFAHALLIALGKSVWSTRILRRLSLRRAQNHCSSSLPLTQSPAVKQLLDVNPQIPKMGTDKKTQVLQLDGFEFRSPQDDLIRKSSICREIKLVHPKIKLEKLAKFSRRFRGCFLTTIHHATTTISPANYHQKTPIISPTPSKTPAKQQK
jgi:hypothetical protein